MAPSHLHRSAWQTVKAQTASAALYGPAPSCLTCDKKDFPHFFYTVWCYSSLHEAATEQSHRLYLSRSAKYILLVSSPSKQWENHQAKSHRQQTSWSWHLWCPWGHWCEMAQVLGGHSWERCCKPERTCRQRSALSATWSSKFPAPHGTSSVGTSFLREKYNQLSPTQIGTITVFPEWKACKHFFLKICGDTTLVVLGAKACTEIWYILQLVRHKFPILCTCQIFPVLIILKLRIGDSWAMHRLFQQR